MGHSPPSDLAGNGVPRSSMLRESPMGSSSSGSRVVRPVAHADVDKVVSRIFGNWISHIYFGSNPRHHERSCTGGAKPRWMIRRTKMKPKKHNMSTSFNLVAFLSITDDQDFFFFFLYIQIKKKNQDFVFNGHFFKRLF
jgi:hypothetical protein